MPQLCQELLDVLNRNLQLDDTLRLIQGIVGFRLCSVAYHYGDAAALAWGMIREQAQVDIELLLREGEDGEKWDVIAKWRVWLIHWGQLFDDLEPGELEDGEVLTLEDIAAEMDINIIQAGGLYYDADDPGRLQNHDDLLGLLCSIQASLIAKVEDLIEPELQQSQARRTVLNVIRRIAEHPWFERYEIVTAVYLDHMTVDARRRHHQIGGTCQKSQVVVEVLEETEETKAVKVLSIVALNALGDQKCLMSMRVCRGICINTAVHERSKIQVADRVAFTYLSFAGRKVLARGFRTTWPWLVSKSVEERGAGMPDCDACYYKTLGPGPELFGVVGNSVFYNHSGEWRKYNSAKIVPWNACLETEETKAVKVLSIVALNALGDQKCLMSMRVCRGICINTAVHERSKIQVADRVAFTYLSFAGRKVLARGFRTTWHWLVSKSVEERGAGMPDCDACYYKTLGPGPELFGVVGNSVFYNHSGEWRKYNSAKIVPWNACLETI